MIPKAIQELIDDFKELNSSTEQFQFFIELASELPAFPEEYKTDDYKIPGCASNAWVAVQKNTSEKIEIFADAEALISKGFLAFFILGFEGCRAEEITQFDPEILQKEGIISSLSPSRANGALASLKKIQEQIF